MMIAPNPQLKRIIAYKPGKSIEELEKELGIKNAIKLASNENPFGTSSKVINTIKNSLNKVHIYPDSNCIKLREKLAEKLDVNVDEIIIGNGSDEIIDMIFKAYIRKGDEILTCTPTFQYYKIAVYQTAGEFKDIPLKNYTFDVEGLEKSINERTKIVIICNPNNPTGTYVTFGELKNFIKNLPDNILLIIDEAYFEFYEKDNKVDGINFIKEFPEKNIIILRTFSKIYGLAALRVGYGISKKEIVNNLNKVRQPFNVNGLAQIAAISALEDKDFFYKVYKNNIKCKKILYNLFDELNIFYLPTQANFIFFDPGIDNEIVFNELLKEGVIIRSLKSFGYNTALRVTVGTEEQNEIFIEKFRKVFYNLSKK